MGEQWNKKDVVSVGFIAFPLAMRIRDSQQLTPISILNTPHHEPPMKMRQRAAEKKTHSANRKQRDAKTMKHFSMHRSLMRFQWCRSLFIYVKCISPSPIQWNRIDAGPENRITALCVCVRTVSVFRMPKRHAKSIILCRINGRFIGCKIALNTAYMPATTTYMYKQSKFSNFMVWQAGASSRHACWSFLWPALNQTLHLLLIQYIHLNVHFFFAAAVTHLIMIIYHPKHCLT